ncbi:MAG: universal stress protein [Chitinophagaceae bacterium]|nr:universal stress protein [Chitinophagaceae bacterium]MBL0132105.1 universal stress protein [Chitinophagaceae bacterium]MBL0271864.1 universal stress protein [Chitinophagaceae bacterium]
MKTIIVPTDFSPVSINAVNFAVNMAEGIEASLLLLNVYNIPVSYSEVPIMLVSVDEMKKSSEDQLAELKKNVIHVTSGKVKVYTESRMGNTVDELEELCKHIQPFAVVMGAKGKTSIEKVVFGSTTLTAIRHLTWPVICVPPGKEYGKGIKKIGFACDFKQVVETTPVQFIRQIVKEFNAELHILNVDYKEKHFRPETPEQSFLLHNLLEDVKPFYHFINNPDIEDGINEFAESNNLDLVIAIPKKHNLLGGIFKPSSTKQLVFQSHIPVMCVHE